MKGWGLSGNLTADPELKFTGTGKAYCNFRIAIRQGKDKDGNEKPAWFQDCVLWNEYAAENFATLVKGTKVMVIGEMKQDHWQTPEGEPRQSNVFAAHDGGASCMFQKVTATKATKEAS